MTYKIYPEQDVEAIAEAIRNKNGLSNKYKIGEMAEAINNLGIYSLSGEDNAPYLYRKTPLTSDAELDKIVGGSVVFNQIVSRCVINGSTISVDDTTYQVTHNGESRTFFGVGVSDGVQYVYKSLLGHKYLWSVNVTNISIADLKGLVFANGMVSTFITSTGVHCGISVGYGTSVYFNATTNTQTTSTSDTFTFKDMMIIDLTQMFGTDIADYAYQLEQATAGSGVNYLKSLGFFTDDYYPYNAGEIKSVSGLDSHDMVGFNQWDEEWENGWIDESGVGQIGANYLRTKNYISVIPNTTYCVTTPYTIYMRYYDADKNYIDKFDANSRGNITAPYGLRTIPTNCAYIRFYIDESTYNNDICINISDTNRNGEYEPYVKHSYPLDNTLTLRGIPKITDGKLYYDGDVYNSDGSVVRKYGVVDLGSLNWSYEQGRDLFETLLVPRAKNSFDAVCSNYPFVGSYSILVDKSCGYIYGYHFAIKDSTYGTDATAFKTAMQGVYLIYELAEPTTETAEPYNTLQICDGAGTEEYVTDGIPVGHETKYLETVEN